MTITDPKPKIDEEALHTLKQKIKSKQIKFGVIGLGYVGLPLAHEFAAIGVDVLGFDVSDDKVNNVNKGISYIQDMGKNLIEGSIDLGDLYSISDEKAISTLTGLRGIGEWTAQMFLIFGLNRIDIFAPKDAGLLKGIRHVYFEGEIANISQIQDIVKK